ncbi:glycosyl hydrolase [Pelagicoccus albus]|uniref:Alpha-L-rhamnosidase n=1 Tax=Pelagicoccus albus TaxID=415222 RepID=A0A7X1B5Y7_9BACT|nr:glycosyl hydrolase [Pelagicoccus albus]MBC2605010.1 hypothetical protein [Pelagicoccus albus]
MPHLKSVLFSLSLILPALPSQAQVPDLKEATSENKPWTRWWWHGSAVNKEEITRELESFAQIGIGGVEITPIYGVEGKEELETEFLSDKWLELMRHAGLEAKRLGMQMDVVPGTGWRLGHELVPDNERAVELELHRHTNAEGETKAYEITAELSGERVKRPAPGGSGYTIDMLDQDAVANYIDRFNRTFFNAVSPDLVRAVFHDSWEYETNWSHDFQNELIYRNRFNSPEMYSIFDPENESVSEELKERFRYDYRVTMEELLLENFSDTWNQKTHAFGLITRNQAHGSPANLLDVYAKTDIPETEIFGDEEHFVIHKFSSSAAHVTKKRLVSSESFTWLSEHWTSDLAKIKRATDYLFLCGVNHLFYHGTAYSPQDATWPGWVFYASTQVNDRNPIWNHLPALNDYIARCQMILQAGQPYSDIYLYYPAADPYSEVGGTKLRQNIDGKNWLLGTDLDATAEELWDAGVHFDFISDRQLADLAASVETSPTIVLPIFERIPLKTVESLIKLAQDGVSVISLQDPKNWKVPGFANWESRQAELDKLVEQALESNYIQIGTVASIEEMSPDTWQDSDGFRTIRRTLRDGTPSYFIVNRSDETKTVELTSLSEAGTCTRFDPWTGQAGYVKSSGGSLELTLNPFESTFIFAGKPSSEKTPFLSDSDLKIAKASIKLAGKWSLSFLKGGPELPATKTLDELAPISELGYPSLEAFAGLLAYENTFELSAKELSSDLLLDLGSLSSSAQVFVNDELVSTLIRSPYTSRIPAEFLQKGTNTLRIEIATLADNRIRDLDRREVPWRIFKDINFVNIDYRAFDASDWEVSPYGLFGPVSVTPVH